MTKKEVDVIIFLYPSHDQCVFNFVLDTPIISVLLKIWCSIPLNLMFKVKLSNVNVYLFLDSVIKHRSVQCELKKV